MCRLHVAHVQPLTDSRAQRHRCAHPCRHFSLSDKLETFLKQYELREDHFEKQLKAVDLEKQLLEAKLEQQTQLALAHKERGEAMLAKVKEGMVAEESLKAQVKMYSAKFDDFQDTVSKSNDAFEGFQKEMAKVSVCSRVCPVRCT